jgi:hypothetical protein
MLLLETSVVIYIYIYTVYIYIYIYIQYIYIYSIYCVYSSSSLASTVLTPDPQEEIALLAAGGDDAVEEELEAAVAQISQEYRQQNFSSANVRYNRDLDRRMAKETEMKSSLKDSSRANAKQPTTGHCALTDKREE